MARRDDCGQLKSILRVLKTEGTDLDEREYKSALSNEFCKHAIRSIFFDLTESTEDREFVVCHHTHMHIRLGKVWSVEQLLPLDGYVPHPLERTSRWLVRALRWGLQC